MTNTSNESSNRSTPKPTYTLHDHEADGRTSQSKIPYVIEQGPVDDLEYWAEWYLSMTHRTNVSDILEEWDYPRQFALCGVVFDNEHGDCIIVRPLDDTEILIGCENALANPDATRVEPKSL